MNSAYEIVADGLKGIIDAEFAPEGWVAEHDDLHESLGWEGPRWGISPLRDTVNANNYIQETWLQVQYFGYYQKRVDPNLPYDPRLVTNIAERFRRAVKAAVVPSTGTDAMWYFNLVDIDYPRDPTGNKTRFVARLRAWGNNSALVETTA